MKRVVPWIYKGARIILVLYAVALAALFFFQESMLFHPGLLEPNYKFQLSLPFEEQRFTAGGVELHSVLVRAKKQPARGLLLFFHGNAGDLGDWSLVGEGLAERTGYDAWVLDYPGFGKSGGKIRSEEQLHEIAKAFYLLGVQETRGSPLVVYGRSLGSAFAVRLAAENKVSGLVLESPFFSMASVAAVHVPWIPVSWLIQYPLRSDEWMPRVTAPVLVLHGARDIIVPVSSGKALAELAKQAKFVEVETAGHNDLDDHDEYWAALSVFLNSLKR